MPPKNTPDLNQSVKKSSWPAFSPVISIVLVVIVALIVGAGLYYLSTKTKSTNDTVSLQTNNNSNANTNQLLGGDADEHGCIGSAGYSWCEEKQKCLRIWEEDCSSATSGNTNGNTNANSNANQNSNTNANTNTGAGDVIPADRTTYINSATGFSFQYPSSWFITAENTTNNVVSWIMESWDSSAIPGRGGMDDGMVKADFSVSPNDGQTLDTVINCSTDEPQYTTIVSFETVTINGRQYKKCTLDSQIEGAARSITLGTVENDKKYIITGIIPVGASQAASLVELDAIFDTFTIQAT